MERVQTAVHLLMDFVDILFVLCHLSSKGLLFWCSCLLTVWKSGSINKKHEDGVHDT